MEISIYVNNQIKTIRLTEKIVNNLHREIIERTKLFNLKKEMIPQLFENYHFQAEQNNNWSPLLLAPQNTNNCFLQPSPAYIYSLSLGESCYVLKGVNFENSIKIM
jgi:hypothetical protein